MRTAIAKLEGGADPFPEKVTTAAYLVAWLGRKRHEVRPGTVKRYEQLVRDHVVPTIGSVQLARVRPQHVQSVLDAMREAELAPRTIARCRAVLGLRWADVNLDLGRIRIVRSLQRTKEGLTALDPKTDRARREISLPSFVTERLRRHRVEQAERRLRAGDTWDDTDLVCDRGDGGPLDPDSFSNAFRRLARSAGLPAEVRLHDVRHGVATALLEQGVHPAIASAVLGHSSPAFTMATYQHVTDGMTDKAAAALDVAFGA
jgi:integrase